MNKYKGPELTGPGILLVLRNTLPRNHLCDLDPVSRQNDDYDGIEELQISANQTALLVIHTDRTATVTEPELLRSGGIWVHPLSRAHLSELECGIRDDCVLVGTCERRCKPLPGCTYIPVPRRCSSQEGDYHPVRGVGRVSPALVCCGVGNPSQRSSKRPFHET